LRDSAVWVEMHRSCGVSNQLWPLRRRKDDHKTGHVTSTTWQCHWCEYTIPWTSDLSPSSAWCRSDVHAPFSRSCLFCHFLPARRYASAGNSDHNVSVCPSVCPSVCNKGGVRKFSDFLGLSVNISKTVADTAYKLLLVTNRKLYTGFRLTATSMTLEDLELL